MEEQTKVGSWSRVAILGSGGFGTVALWRCSITNDAIAVKKCKLHCQSSLSSRQKERWHKEVQKIQELDHPNIVKYKILPSNLEGLLKQHNPTKLPLLPMEYCQKGNLRHKLSQTLNLRGLKENDVICVLQDISEAVFYLHSLNITHRDIKPENIVLADCSERPNREIFKLIDLGYAKELRDSTVSFVGTLYYLAPEIFSNQIYDCTVDYWSLGILAFEIICGVLPFCTSLNHVERFNMIKEKGPDDICIYKTKLGNYHYSKELFKENHVNHCLKSHMEIWLRRVLQFNPKLRVISKETSLNIFDHLKSILKKNILKVFSVYNYEFYSYEFDEHTKLSTLQQWIARDTSISEEDQLLLGSLQLKNCDEQTVLIDYLGHGNHEIFIFKRAFSFVREPQRVPRLVKLLFEKTTETFKWRDVKQIYSDSIYYISQDLLLASFFSKAMNLLLNYLKILMTEIQIHGVRCKQYLKKLLQSVDRFVIQIKEELVPFKSKAFAKEFLTIFESIKKLIETEVELRENIVKWDTKVKLIGDMYSQLDIMKLPQLEELLKKATIILQTTAEKANSNEDFSLIEMSKVVSQVMKMKNKLLCHKDLDKFVGFIGKAVNHLESLTSWMSHFNDHGRSVAITFDTLKAENSEGADDSTGKPSNKTNVLNHSEVLMSRFCEDLDSTEANYKEMSDDISSFLTETLGQTL